VTATAAQVDVRRVANRDRAAARPAWEHAAMLIVNAADCEPGEAIERLVFRARAFDLTERALEPGEARGVLLGPGRGPTVCRARDGS